ncbi:MAG: NYN domain-containing protein [Candidatus Brocadiales bacterium]
MHIIIDGYNLIFAVPALEKVLDRESMETARETLLTALSRHKITSGQEFTVVFDGRAQEGEGQGPSQKQIRGGISVIFSKSTTADEDIENLINSSSNPKNMCIVTSDKSILKAAKASGCRVTRPRDFYKKITQPLKKGRVLPRAEPMVKYQGPSEEEVDYWLKLFKTKSKRDKTP